MIKKSFLILISLFISTGTVAEYAMTTNVMDLGAKQKPNDMYGAAKVSTHYFLEVQARKIKQPFIWCVIPITFGERRVDNNIITYKTKVEFFQPFHSTILFIFK